MFSMTAKIDKKGLWTLYMQNGDLLKKTWEYCHVNMTVFPSFLYNKSPRNITCRLILRASASNNNLTGSLRGSLMSSVHK